MKAATCAASGVVLALLVGCINDSAKQSSSTQTVASTCRIVQQRAERSSNAFGNGLYQKAYDASVSGLHYLALCDDSDIDVENKGFLMLIKAISERKLASGDSVTDMNQAITLLEECQTHPGFYGTHIGAECETAQEEAIKMKERWELDSY